MLRKIQRVGKRATKFQYSATYQSVVIECLRDKWHPSAVCVSWTRKGRRLITKVRPWQPSPDNKMRGVVIWPDPENIEITVTLYKGPKDKSYESKEWEFAVIDVDQAGKRKVLATTSINMVRYASSMPFETDLTLRLKPVSRKIKSVILQVSLSSMFLKEGKATDVDMMSIASMMSVSNLSNIGFLEDEDDEEYYWTGGRSVSPAMLPEHVLSTDQLLDWARDVTKDIPSVKISNMTTSWRNGMGFLAIFHYHRPDLIPDFDMLSPTSIKENNRQAFELAHSLGVACPLTPNMMVTTTVPDKLAVTSFVYQLHQYFTRATQSAVAKAGNNTGNSPSDPERAQSPFDISKIPEMFSGKLSPVSPPPSTDKVNFYSRHSSSNSLADVTSNHKPDSSKGSSEEYDIKIPTRSGELHQEISVSPASKVKLQLDLLVRDYESDSESKLANQVSHKEVTAASPKNNERVVDVQEKCEDRVVEYENPCETESSESLSTETTSSFPAGDDDEQSRYPDLPLDPKPLCKANLSLKDPKEISTTGRGRKLPSPPVDAESREQIAKREERRRQAQEMLKKHRIKINTTSTDRINTGSSPSTDSKYRQQAIQMLTEAFNSPVGSRKASLPQNEEYLSSDGSASSLSVVDNSPSMKRHHSTGSIGIISLVQNVPTPDLLNSEKSGDNSDVVKDSEANDEGDSEQEITKKALKTRVSDSNLLAQASSLNVNSLERRNSASSINSQPPDAGIKNKRLSSIVSARPNSADHSKTNKKRQLPAVRPVSAQPSQTLVRLQEQKRREEEKRVRQEEAKLAAAKAKRFEEQKNEIDSAPRPVEGEMNELSGSQDDRSEIPSMSKQIPRVTPVVTSLSSPAWSQHSEDLSQDLLVTQSEYVKTELLGLKEIMVGLEEKAGNMELKVREAMDDGDKEKEEELMQEWFGLLNKKNELIKRQIELSIIEKEEDLEKRQFFINRELRPLMEIPDNEKTEQQKEKDSQLLRQLLELIDERDKLERRKLSAQKSSDHERSSFAMAQATTELAPNDYPSKQGGKDCVVS